MLAAKRTLNSAYLAKLARPFSTFSPMMAHEALIENQIYTPKSKMYFINHPRYGEVYPVFTYNFDKTYWKLPIYSFCGLSVVNSMVLYGSFI